MKLLCSVLPFENDATNNVKQGNVKVATYETDASSGRPVQLCRGAAEVAVPARVGLARAVCDNRARAEAQALHTRCQPQGRPAALHTNVRCTLLVAPFE